MMYRALTLQSGVYKQVQDADTLGVGGGVTTAAGVNLVIAAGAGGTVNLTGAAVLSGGLTASGATDWDWSGSSGQFKTSTGAVQLSGSTTVAANKNLSCAAGTTAVDFHLGTGTFDTSTGAVGINGSATLAANKNLSCLAGTTALDFSLGTGAFATSSGAVGINGTATVAANKNLLCAAGTSQLDFSLGTGIFKTPTGVGTYGCTTNAFTNVIYPYGGIQRPAASAGTIEIGTDANTTAINVGSVGVLTHVLGDLTVAGIETVVGTSEFDDDALFKGDVVFGDAAADTVSFVASVGPAGAQDISFVKELAHVIRVTTSTTAVTAGGALSVLSGTGNGAAGGALTIDTGTGTAGGALTIGGANAASVGIGRAAITTTITGTISLAGHTTLTANSNLLCAAGTSQLDFSLGTGIFSSPSGAGTLNGTTTVAANKNLLCAAGTSQLDFSLGTGIFATSSGAVSINGTATVAANKNLLCAAGTSLFDFSLGTGIFKTSTGACTIGGGANAIGITSSGAAITVTAGAASTWKTTAGALTIEGFVGINLNGDPADTYMDLGVTGANIITVTAGHTFDSTAATATKINTGVALWLGAVQCTANVTGTNLNELTGGGVTALHSHVGGGLVVVSGEALAAGAPVSMANAAGSPKAYNADADGAGTKANVIAFAVAPIAFPGNGTIQTTGELAIPDAQWDAAGVPAVGDVGLPFYLSETVGKVSKTAPAVAGSTVLRCGYITVGGAGAVKVAINIGDGVVL